jgi:MFS family permease
MSLENDGKLFNSSFIAACSANFLYFFGFYSLLPIMALYLIDTFQTDKIITGAVMACYTLLHFMFRPFGGYLVDKLKRKKLYVIALAIFVLCFEGIR